MFSLRFTLILSLSLILFACDDSQNAESSAYGNGNIAELVYLSDQEAGFDIYKNTIKGNKEVRLTQSPENESNPRWINERNVLLYTGRDSAGNPITRAIGLDGKPVEYDTKGLADIFPSPQGDKVVFIQEDKGKSTLILKYLTTKGDTFHVATADHFNGRPAWSKRGDRLTYISDISGSNELYVYSISDRKTLRLTNNDWEESYSSWSPTDRYIAVTMSNDSMENDIYLYDVPSKGLYPLAYTPHVETEIAWSPISDVIAFRANFEGKEDIFVMDVESKEIKKVTNSKGSYREPDWIVR